MDPSKCLMVLTVLWIMLEMSFQGVKSSCLCMEVLGASVYKLWDSYLCRRFWVTWFKTGTYVKFPLVWFFLVGEQAESLSRCELYNRTWWVYLMWPCFIQFKGNLSITNSINSGSFLCKYWYLLICFLLDQNYSTMMLMERVDVMDAMIILAGTVVLKVPVLPSIMYCSSHWN